LDSLKSAKNQPADSAQISGGGTRSERIEVLLDEEYEKLLMRKPSHVYIAATRVSLLLSD
jgi:hypothetical protein